MIGKLNLWDSRDGYGLLSRLFHWTMALLIIWQFISALLRVFAKNTAVSNFFWSTHFTLGFTLFILVISRGIWALFNSRSRPYKASLLGKFAVLGHLLLYGLIITIPILGVLRLYAHGIGFSYFGVSVLPATGIEDGAMVAFARQFHSLLGWLLLLVIAGHVLMVLIHQFVLRDKTLSYMTIHR